MFNWEIIGYIGIFFASVYRLPQIIKIYKTKRGEDVSKKAFILQNAAYVSFIAYVCGKAQGGDIILIIYYIIGIILNILILMMKEYYKQRSTTIEDGSP